MRERLRMILVVERGLRGTHGLHELRAGARGFANDIPLRVSPMRGHLAAAGAGVVFRSNGLQQHLQRRDAHEQAERAVAVIGIEPIHARAKQQSDRGCDGFVPGARNLKENLVLALELDFAVIEPPGEKHRSIQPDQCVAVEAQEFLGIQLEGFDARLNGHT